MFRRTAKIGGVVLVALTLGEMIQTHSVGSPFVLFIAAGIIPGTKLQLPAWLMLLASASMLMVIVAFLFRERFAWLEALRMAAPKHMPKRRDPSYRTLIPGLGGALVLARAVRFRVGESARDASVLFRSLGQPTIAQTMAIRKTFVRGLLQAIWSSVFRLRWRDWMVLFFSWLRGQSTKVQAYITRLTLL